MPPKPLEFWSKFEKIKTNDSIKHIDKILKLIKTFWDEKADSFIEKRNSKDDLVEVSINYSKTINDNSIRIDISSDDNSIELSILQLDSNEGYKIFDKEWIELWTILSSWDIMPTEWFEEKLLKKITELEEAWKSFEVIDKDNYRKTTTTPSSMFNILSEERQPPANS